MTPEIEFEDFVPLMLELAEAARLVAENPELRRSQEEGARVAALDFLLKDMGEDVMLQVGAALAHTDRQIDRYADRYRQTDR